MSLSENAQRFIRLMAFGAFAVVAGCQVKPLYSDGPQGKPATALASVSYTHLTLPTTPYV